MKTAVALGIVVFAVAAGGAQAPPQTPPRDQPRAVLTGSAVISGTVVADDETRAPLRSATVELSRTGVEDIRSTSTDDQGRFVFDRLPAASYALSATKGAYIPMSYGAPKPGMSGRSIALSDGQAFAAKPIALTRGGVIAGRLLDRNGLPVSGTIVTANRFMVANGERRRRLTEGSERQSVTNAHGDYRIYGLLPGEYLVYAGSASSGTETEVTAVELRWASQAIGPAPRPGRSFTYAPTIFPGTADAAIAVPIVLARGEERLGVDFALQYVPVAKVTGFVTGPAGKPASNVTVRYSFKQPNQFTTNSLTSTRTGPDGGFAFTGVPPGDYVLVARSLLAAPESLDAGARGGLTPVPLELWGIVDLNLAGQDVSDVAIRLQPGMSVSGRVVLKGSAANSPPDLARVVVRLGSLSAPSLLGGPPSAMVNADGTFKVDGVMPGSSALTVTLPAQAGGTSPWFVRSALSGGQDLMDVPLEVPPGSDVSNIVVTLSDVRSEVVGTLVDSAGQPAPEFYVFMFSTDKTSWTTRSRRIKFTRASDTGSYVIGGLPPGEYFLCALTELDMELRFEPSYLEQLVPASTKITLAEGEKKIQNLRIGGSVPGV